MLKRCRFALLLVPLLALSACQTTTPTTAAGTTPSALQTFDALYANAVSADDLAIKAATVALQSGFINATQASMILGITDSVKAALDTANAAAQSGDIGTASGNLAAALGPIAILSACLTTKPLTVQTFAACSVKLTPVVQS